MIGALTAAMATLHSDRNLGTDATYARGALSFPVRVVFAAPADVLGSIGSTPGRAPNRHARVLATAMATAGITPRRNDTVTIAGTTYRVDDSEPDDRGLYFRLTLVNN